MVPSPVSLKVIAPSRIDLAGATLDIYPLYVFEGGGLTINVAIDLYSEVQLDTRSDGLIRIESRDFGLSMEAENLETLHCQEEFRPLDLIVRILKFYRPHQGLELRTKNSAPAGSGLGGSSSLLVSLSTSLIQLNNLPLNKNQMIEFGANIEAQSIRIPTGKQDYFPPAYGGFHALWFQLDGIRREQLIFSSAFLDQMKRQILLGYSGASRFSGTSNWNMMKRYIDSEGPTVSNFNSIKQTVLGMYESLMEEDFDKFAESLAKEWEIRKTLAEGVTTPTVEKIFQAAQSEGALASKLCGAGGGGCFITLVKEGRQQAVREAIESSGGQLLEYGFSMSGVQVLEEDYST